MFLYSERDENLRSLFRKKLESIPCKKLIYLDECGFDTNEKYKYGWGKIGERVLDEKRGSRGQRVNIIAAINSKKDMIAPLVFSGNCNSDVFNQYVSEILLPALPRKSVVVLDNASFHTSSNIQKILNKKKCQVFFLPPYSPDFNPIEQMWSPIKNDLRKRFRDVQKDPFLAVVDVLRNRST